MGGRVPVQLMLNMAEAAGYTGRIVSLVWKIQSEPETVIGEYAENQKRGIGRVSISLIQKSCFRYEECTDKS